MAPKGCLECEMRTRTLLRKMRRYHIGNDYYFNRIWIRGLNYG